MGRDRVTGQTFGRWRVLGCAGRNSGRHALWHVQCQCGTRAIRSASDLRWGRSQSCGCLRAEQLAASNRAGNKPARERPSRPCDCCGQSYRPQRSTSRYCSRQCRGRAGWQRIAGNPRRKMDHSRRVTEAKKDAIHVLHDACAGCGKPFRAAPSRRHCSSQCRETVIASGKYRSAFLRRRAEAELAAIAAEMEDRQ